MLSKQGVAGGAVIEVISGQLCAAAVDFERLTSASTCRSVQEYFKCGVAQRPARPRILEHSFEHLRICNRLTRLRLDVQSCY